MNLKNYSQRKQFYSNEVPPLLSERMGANEWYSLIDLGCGDGALTINLTKLGCSVVGIDTSDDMVAAARKLGIDAQVGDAEQLTFVQEFDAVFSNAALHWMPAADDVVAGVWRALKPGGRFVGEFGGFGNVATVMAAVDQVLAGRGLEVPDPWFFPVPDVYTGILEAAGFTVQHIELSPRLTPLPGAMSAWLETFYRPFLEVIPAGDWPEFVDGVCTRLQPDLLDATGIWHVDYVRLQFSATKPSP